MSVYGDRMRTVDPRRAIVELEHLLNPGASPGELQSALILAGELAQGLADAEVEHLGFDDDTPLQTAAMDLAVAIAGRAHAGEREETCAKALAALGAMSLPARIRCKRGEGFAFYAVYPECYAAAAASHPWGAPPLAIGLRSIGTTLAATVAAVAGGRAISLRPRGHPFRREVQVSDRLRAELGGHRGPLAIVDEGPGLSGSSFGCVADLLDDLGVAPERLVFMPSHPGPLGPEASARHRERWAGARRLVRTLDDLVAAEPLARWFEDAIGSADVCDISAGAWRYDLAPPWPPAAPGWERRKFRLHAPEGEFVARFAGLGAIGEEKLGRARALYEAGFGSEPIALRRGFLLERWVDGAPLAAARDRPALLSHLGRYLGFRAQTFAAGEEDGASAERLGQMAASQAAQLCGREVGERVAAALQGRGSAGAPVHVDGRLHAWEWRRLDDRFCKLDGLDHSCGHDLVGAQSIGWDVAGARVEFALDQEATAALAKKVEADPGTIEALTICYAAFQGGLWRMAEQGAASRAEAACLRRRAASYAGKLAHCVRPVARRGGLQTPAFSPAASRAR